MKHWKYNSPHKKGPYHLQHDFGVVRLCLTPHTFLLVLFLLMLFFLCAVLSVSLWKWVTSFKRAFLARMLCHRAFPKITRDRPFKASERQVLKWKRKQLCSRSEHRKAGIKFRCTGNKLCKGTHINWEHHSVTSFGCANTSCGLWAASLCLCLHPQEPPPVVRSTRAPLIRQFVPQNAHPEDDSARERGTGEENGVKPLILAKAIDVKHPRESGSQKLLPAAMTTWFCRGRHKTFTTCVSFLLAVPSIMLCSELE